MFSRSIRVRLLWWLGFLLICLLGGFGVTAYQLHRTHRLGQIDDELERRLVALSADFRGRARSRLPSDFRRDQGRGPMLEFDPTGPPRMDDHLPFKPELQAATLSLFDPVDPKGFYFSIWTRTGRLLKASTNAPSQVPFPQSVPGDTRSHTRMREDVRETYHFTERDDCILVGRPVGADMAASRRFGWLLGAVGAVVLVIGLGGGWALASRAIQPVEHISAAASRIAAGNLSERISLEDTDSELGRLADVLNSTFARLEAAFAEQKQFTADASHEIRTPLAVLISEAQTALARNRDAAEYRQTIEVCLQTAQQMRRLTDSLLKLARFDAGQEMLTRTPVELAEIARTCIELVRPLAAQKDIQIHCQLQPVQIQGDADGLRQLITNLLTNAIQYNKPNGEIHASTQANNGGVFLTVRDTGVGIAAGDLPRIFERFYRADKSRSRNEGHTGLGLAICQAIVVGHGGQITVESELGKGATFTVRLPIG